MIKNRLVQFLVASAIASSAIAAPAEQPPHVDVIASNSAFHEYLTNVDEHSIHKFMELLGQYRSEHAAHSTSPIVKMGKRDSRSSAVEQPKPTTEAPQPQTTAAPTTEAPATKATTEAPATTQAPAETSSSHSEEAPSTEASVPSTTAEAPSTTAEAPSTSETKTEPTTKAEPTTHTTAAPTTHTTAAPTTHEPSKTEHTTERTTEHTTEPTTEPTTSKTSEKTSEKTTQAPTTIHTTTSEDHTTEHTTAETHTTPYTSTYKSTTTLPNGERSTVTAVTVVHPTRTNHAAATGSGTGPAPGLQTDSAASTNGLGRELFVMMGGAAMVAMAL